MKTDSARYNQSINKSMSKLKVGIAGVGGRMGRALVEAVLSDAQAELVCASVSPNSSLLGADVGEIAGFGRLNVKTVADLSDALAGTDVLIDFTSPESTLQHLALCAKSATAIVVGTTGFTNVQQDEFNRQAQQLPCVFAANFSTGVNIALELVAKAAKVLGDAADIEIVEAHHRHKKDSPSGTALALGQAAADSLHRDLKQVAVYGREGMTGERERETIGFATVRGGDVVGDHSVQFLCEGERLEIVHKASSRLAFAKGAVRAAHWLKDTKTEAGIYSMSDVLSL